MWRCLFMHRAVSFETSWPRARPSRNRRSTQEETLFIKDDVGAHAGRFKRYLLRIRVGKPMFDRTVRLRCHAVPISCRSTSAAVCRCGLFRMPFRSRHATNVALPVHTPSKFRSRHASRNRSAITSRRNVFQNTWRWDILWTPQRV